MTFRLPPMMTGNQTATNFQQPMDPDSYAKQYAQQNGIDFETAKAELKSKYGDPQQPQTNSNATGVSNSYASMDIFEKMDLLNQINAEEENKSNSQNGQSNPFANFFQQFMSGFNSQGQSAKDNGSQFANISTNSLPQQQDPNQVAQEYMKQWNEEHPDETITLQEAIETLKEQYGNP